MDRLAVETGSFSAAARRLGLGQAAISKLIAQQEARLGSLLLRSTRGLTLIERGGGIPLARATEAGGAVNE
ncbi:helix-turn-helix domain-containing protein [Aeromonas sobria]|uniref:helix-turn-helix domain-containing protein n=1 Tax=Aeromonas sobria TaxID=646 RepID=UPI003D0437A8